MPHWEKPGQELEAEPWSNAVCPQRFMLSFVKGPWNAATHSGLGLFHPSCSGSPHLRRPWEVTPDYLKLTVTAKDVPKLCVRTPNLGVTHPGGGETGGFLLTKGEFLFSQAHMVGPFILPPQWLS